MYPEEHEYIVGPTGFTMSREGADYFYEPGSRVWLARAPLAADLKPTGQRRRYETKVERAGEPVVSAISAAGEPVLKRPRGRPRKHG
jgi:hypothetical protein